MNWLKILQQRREERAELLRSIDSVETRDQLDKIEMDIRRLNLQIIEAEEHLEEERNAQGVKGQEQEPEARNQSGTPNNLNPIATYGMGQTTRSTEEIEEMEYRNAFMNYVLSGKSIDERADQTTQTTDVGVLIPQTVVNKIVEKLNSFGTIFARITKTNIKGGISIPTSSAKPVATWMGEGIVADKQKKAVDGEITFSYHKLQCRVAVSLEADTTSLSIFEQTIIDNVYEAMIIALEQAIISGTGIKQPLGITKDTGVKAAQKLAVKPAEIAKWHKWSRIFAQVPLAKRQGVVLILNNETWEGDIMGMVDANDQPVARINVGLNGEDKPIFKGKEVIPTEMYLPSFETAETGEVFGILVNLKDYLLNSNLQMTIKRYFDEDSDEWITKSTLIADGKLSDAQGVILLTKGAVA